MCRSLVVSSLLHLETVSLTLGKRRVTKRSLKSKHPLNKEYLYQFSKQHSEVFEKYKTRQRDLREIDDASLDTAIPGDEYWKQRREELRQIAPGDKGAEAYHSIMWTCPSFETTG